MEGVALTATAKWVGCLPCGGLSAPTPSTSLTEPLLTWGVASVQPLGLCSDLLLH